MSRPVVETLARLADDRAMKSTQWLFALAASSAWALAASPAQAQHFGEAGQLVIQSDEAIGVAVDDHTQVRVAGTSPGGGANVSLQPAADYFVMRNLSVGGLLRYAHRGDVDRFGIGGRVGYDLTINDNLTFWPVGAIEIEGGSGPTNLAFVAYAPLLWHPVQHFFVGLGPFLEPSVPFSGPGGTVTSFGVQSTVGGWFVP
jgi:hypothetical protein